MSDPGPIGEGDGIEAKRVPTIVFVDDEEPILSSLRSLFRRSGYGLHTFARAVEALEFVNRVPVDVIVSDLRMPVMTGIEFLNHAAGANPQAVRIILSGYEDKGVVLDALSQGLAHHYMLKPWDDPSIQALIAQSLTRLEELRRKRLEEVLGSVTSLPNPPSVTIRIQSVLARASSSVDAIAREIETSPPIVANLLRVANSIHYASRNPIRSVRDAVLFIGTEYVAGFVTAMEAFQGFKIAVGSDSYGHIEQLWATARARAMIAKAIAEKWPGNVDPSLTHVASLLQDIGYAVRLCSDPAKYDEYLRLCREGPMQPYEADMSVFGVTHDDVGAALLEYWNLPATIVEGVRRHHRNTEGNTLVQIMQVAAVMEGTDRTLPHDPAVGGLIKEWEGKVQREIRVDRVTSTT